MGNYHTITFWATSVSAIFRCADVLWYLGEGQQDLYALIAKFDKYLSKPYCKMHIYNYKEERINGVISKYIARKIFSPSKAS